MVQNRQIDLFYIPKAKIVSAFDKHKLTIDYPDTLAEPAKAKLASAFEKGLTQRLKKQAAGTLCKLIGETSLSSYVDRVRAALGALPQEIRIIAQRQSQPAIFETISAATAFLDAPEFDWSRETTNFVYEITYTDGTEFERTLENIEDVKRLHHQIDQLATHMASLRRPIATAGGDL